MRTRDPSRLSVWQFRRVQHEESRTAAISSVWDGNNRDDRTRVVPQYDCQPQIMLVLLISSRRATEDARKIYRRHATVSPWLRRCTRPMNYCSVALSGCYRTMSSINHCEPRTVNVLVLVDGKIRLLDVDDQCSLVERKQPCVTKQRTDIKY
ncbi:hypothetical protein LSAT2_007413 [Lamellibrachia satsuma]|nr:hypothetical protein LSAT2_007413 [Lamellibrachia satsuma]